MNSISDVNQMFWMARGATEWNTERKLHHNNRPFADPHSPRDKFLSVGLKQGFIHEKIKHFISFSKNVCDTHRPK